MKNFDDFNYMMAHHSTDAEIDQDEATWDGYKFKDRAWLLSPRDVWYKNPYYKGKPIPHPEHWDD
jgi:hypothetical protein